MAPTLGKCPDNKVDCCGICYYPDLEDCIRCKIVEKESISEISPSETPISEIPIIEPDAENIYDLIQENKIEVEATGSGISSLSLKIKPKVNFNIKVHIPAGTLFTANRGSTQNMVSTKSKSVTIEVEVKPGVDIGIEKKEQPATYVDVPVACANLHKDVPASTDTFTIEKSPNQEELEKLLPILDAEDAIYPVKQAAIWIITDDADYNDLGTLICKNGARAINESEAAEALRLIDKAGIDINNKAIRKDRDKIQEENTGKPSCYSEGTIVLVRDDIPVIQPVTSWTWKCGTCPAGYQGPNEKCECWKWVTYTRYV